MNAIALLFTNHPSSVGESYLQHMGFALRFSALLGLAATAALVHAILPFLCKKTASRIVARLYDRTHNRGNASPDGAEPTRADLATAGSTAS